MPNISVIIPTHDRPDMVAAAVRSVLEQTYRDLELIVVDVGIRARAEKALRAYESDLRMTYIKHPTELPGGAARNIGAALAKGEWIAFLDDDDVWLPNKLEVQMQAIAEASEKAGFCFSSVYNELDDRREQITHVLEGEQNFGELSYSRFKGFLTVTLVIRADVFRTVGGFNPDLPSHQEPELIMRIAQKWTGVGVDRPLVRVNMRSGHDHIGANLTKRIEGRRMVLRLHEEEYAVRPAVLARHWFQIGLWERERGEKKAAAAAMLKAFGIDRKLRYILHFFRNRLK